jgi:hypothetical protein
MSTPANQSKKRFSLPSLALTAFGALSCVALSCIAYRTPEWYAYLNWKPGFASILADRAPFIAALLATVVALRMFLLQQPAYILLGVASVIGLYNAHDIARHVGYSTGIAKVECWTPESRECLLGKFERIEKLKNHKVPVVLTEKESAVFTSFKSTRASFEATKPSGFGDEFKNWAQDYRKALDQVFAGYPSAYPN